MSDFAPFSSTPDGTGTIIALCVQPRASQTEVVGVHDGALRLRIAAPPVDGAANAEVVAFLKKRLGVSKSAVQILSGETRRRKRVVIEGMTPTVVRQSLIT